MTLTLADVAKWNPEAIRDVAKALTKKGASAQEVADGLKKLPIIASWEGQAGTAAKESLGRLAMFLTTHAEQMETLNKALLKSADDVEAVRRDLSAMQTDADNWHFNVNYQTGAVSATDSTDESTADAHKTELEGDVAKVLTTANGVDQELASALANATGAPAANGDHTPGSLPFTIDTVNTPPPPSERFSAAERYIYDEIVRNRNSDAVRDIHGHLTPPVSIFDGGIAAREFYNRVRAGGVWDHKPKIEKLLGIESPNKLDPNHYFQVPGTNEEVLYDIYSNIHYGYIGREAGFPTENLIFASGLNTAATGTNDAGDVITMRGGAALYEKYGPNMTAEQFHTGLLDIVHQLDVAKQAGQNVPQIRYLP